MLAETIPSIYNHLPSPPRLPHALPGSHPQTQRIYWRTLNYTPPAVAAAPPPSHGGISDGQRITIAAVVSAVGAALCLAAALGGYAWYRRRQAARHRTLFGRMVAPGASPATCLVVTVSASHRMAQLPPAAHRHTFPTPFPL